MREGAARRAAVLLAAGRCVWCLLPNASRPGKRYCRACQDKINAVKNRLRAKWKLRGLCYNCGGTPLTGRRACGSCHDRAASFYALKKRIRAREAG